MKNFMIKAATICASFAFIIAGFANGAASVFHLHEPKEPKL